ncbi:unnamed protein product [Arctia plantaginis]|uniref:trypsin n=1 Tax=Arctia plantaginis TaxID=874455 RepID=A0A8S1ACM5_ARCPL|nr:unnamed protein product [Arctia plantaginis]
MLDSSIWILPVEKVHINVKNVYVIDTPSSSPKQETTKHFATEGYNRDGNYNSEDSVEIGGRSYYGFVKHQNKGSKAYKHVRSTNEMDKIVGGVEVDINLYPYHVAYGSNCGGAIIHERWVMTAGHCGKKPYIRVGSKYIHQGKKVMVQQNFIHPEWLEKIKAHPFDYDYQLLKLNESLKFEENIQPIKIARMEDMIVGIIMTVTGWGHTSENGGYSTVLRAVRVPIISKENCQNVPFPYFRGSLTTRMFCAGYPEGMKDACQGDSGGPAVIGERLLGIVSFGYGCATPGSYGVYSKVVQVREWVEATTEMKFD